MSDLTLLVAEFFLVVAVGLILVFIGKLAADKWAEIVTGVLHGNPVSPGVREGMLLGMWFPWQASVVALAAFAVIAQLEIANHVANGNIKLVVQFGAFLAAIHLSSALCVMTIGLFGLRRKLRRDKLRQAEAD
jgi:hypothetical protein